MGRGGGVKKTFMENVDLGARNNPLKFPPHTLCFIFCGTFYPQKSVFCLYLDKYESIGKLQDSPSIPHKISYMIVSLKVSPCLLVRRGTSLEITNFIIFAYISEEKTCRLNFRTIKIVCHLIFHQTTYLTLNLSSKLRNYNNKVRT